MTTPLHPKLQADCFNLGTVKNSSLLLHKNALVRWFILVPDSSEDELYKLDQKEQLSVNTEINLVASFAENYFKADKLNIATIGNIVPQLHVHIIARHKTDFCWPNPVWGQADTREYNAAEVQSIIQALITDKILQTN